MLIKSPIVQLNHIVSSSRLSFYVTEGVNVLGEWIG
jgi:hypothetical protein